MCKVLCKGCFYKHISGGCTAPDSVPDDGCSKGFVYLAPYRDPKTGKLIISETLF